VLPLRLADGEVRAGTGILMAGRGTAAMNRQHLLDWIEPDELEPCERCGERAGLRIEEAGTFVCFGCAYIRWAGGETRVDALQGARNTESRQSSAASWSY
jgi:hypothetical protein